MLLSRRRALFTLGGLIAAPAVVKASSLMRVVVPSWFTPASETELRRGISEDTWNILRMFGTRSAQNYDQPLLISEYDDNGESYEEWLAAAG